MKFSLKKFKRKIAANSQTDIDVYGDKVFARSVPAGCKIKFDDGEAVDFYTGLRFGVNSWLVDMLGGAFPALAAKLSSNVFRKISIVNENAAAVNVEVIAGFGDISDDSTVISGTVRANPLPTLASVQSHIVDAETVSLWSSTQVVEMYIQNTGEETVMIYPTGLKSSKLYLRGGDSISLPQCIAGKSWIVEPVNPLICGYITELYARIL